MQDLQFFFWGGSVPAGSSAVVTDGGGFVGVVAAVALGGTGWGLGASVGEGAVAFLRHLAFEVSMPNALSICTFHTHWALPFAMASLKGAGGKAHKESGRSGAAHWKERKVRCFPPRDARWQSVLLKAGALGATKGASGWWQNAALASQMRSPFALGGADASCPPQCLVRRLPAGSFGANGNGGWGFVVWGSWAVGCVCLRVQCCAGNVFVFMFAFALRRCVFCSLCRFCLADGLCCLWLGFCGVLGFGLGAGPCDLGAIEGGGGQGADDEKFRLQGGAPGKGASATERKTGTVARGQKRLTTLSLFD